ncbi:stage V sporulation protein AE [Shouchella lonarensis]|uniref:stage V sporulation protein AE n=1 Tax=Shouchella lonarensis TaxID=1464122 RepID=UPI000B835794|nr:stage V sporulation protein AE [Shouchella lonarensis]
MEYIWAFLVGGAICFVGQMLLDIGKLSPVQVLVTLMIFGMMLDGFHLYDFLISVAGAGATLPITGLGHSLVHGAMNAGNNGLFSISDGLFDMAAVTFVFSILFSVTVALLFRPHGGV